MRRRLLLAGVLSLGVKTAKAAERVGLGFTTGESVSAFAAQDEGYFAQAGLDVDLSYIAMNSNMPAALLSGSLQVGSVTVPVFLQAVDNGIDLVALAGATSVGPANADNYALVVRSGVAYAHPADLLGKRVAVPGFGAIMHVLLVEWLRSKGVDPAGVHYVEATFVAMPDLLRAGSIDAALTIQPFTGRIADSGAGRFVGSFVDELPGPIAGLIYVATRNWAEARPDRAQAVQRAIQQGADYANTHPDAARTMIGRTTKMPADALARVPLPVSTPALGRDAFTWMIAVMRRQDLLHGGLDEGRLLLG